MHLINPKLIELNLSLLEVFPVDPDALAKVEQSLRTFGYDLNKPVMAGIWAGQTTPLCLDGYVRVIAARNLGLRYISMSLQDWFSNHFATEPLGGEEAWGLSWAFSLRSEGRAVTDQQLMQVLNIMCTSARRCRLEAKKKVPKLRYSDSILKAINLADICHVSYDRAEEAKCVFGQGDREIIQAIHDGNLLIGDVHPEMQKNRLSRASR
jgi:hypothetical protein